jgi:hypothetical protein
MKKLFAWVLALIITLSAAIYQRKTGPTYPRIITSVINDSVYTLEMPRGMSLDRGSWIRLPVNDTSVKATVYYKVYKSPGDYQNVGFRFRVRPVKSFVMNKVFRVYEVSGMFAEFPPQPPAGKLQYFLEISDRNGTRSLMKETPVVVRFRGGVPSFILVPHVILMFMAMLYSTSSGIMAIGKIPSYKKTGTLALGSLIAGGMILGPVVQQYAFGEFWTGIPFGWDLTDNKTLIAVLVWILAIAMNRAKERPLYIMAASIILLLVYLIPHSLFGSELDHATGKVIQGYILFTLAFRKNYYINAAFKLNPRLCIRKQVKSGSSTRDKH